MSNYVVTNEDFADTITIYLEGAENETLHNVRVKRIGYSDPPSSGKAKVVALVLDTEQATCEKEYDQ